MHSRLDLTCPRGDVASIRAEPSATTDARKTRGRAHLPPPLLPTHSHSWASTLSHDFFRPFDPPRSELHHPLKSDLPAWPRRLWPRLVCSPAVHAVGLLPLAQDYPPPRANKTAHDRRRRRDTSLVSIDPSVARNRTGTPGPTRRQQRTRVGADTESELVPGQVRHHPLSSARTARTAGCSRHGAYTRDDRDHDR